VWGRALCGPQPGNFDPESDFRPAVVHIKRGPTPRACVGFTNRVWIRNNRAADRAAALWLQQHSLMTEEMAIDHGGCQARYAPPGACADARRIEALGKLRHGRDQLRAGLELEYATIHGVRQLANRANAQLHAGRDILRGQVPSDSDPERPPRP